MRNDPISRIIYWTAMAIAALGLYAAISIIVEVLK